MDADPPGLPDFLRDGGGRKVVLLTPLFSTVESTTAVSTDEQYYC